MKGKPNIWITKDGKWLKICEMDDRHLLNSFRMLYRIGAEDETNYNYKNLKQEIYKRKLRPIWNGYIESYIKEARNEFIEGYREHSRIIEEMLSGDGYKDFI